MSVILHDADLIIFADKKDEIGWCCGNGCSDCKIKKKILESGTCSIMKISSAKRKSVYLQSGKYVYAQWRNGRKFEKVYLGKVNNLSGVVLEKLNI